MKQAAGYHCDPEMRFAGFMAKKQHACQRAKSSPQPGQAQKYALRDTPLPRSGEKFVQTHGQESQDANENIVD